MSTNTFIDSYTRDSACRTILSREEAHNIFLSRSSMYPNYECSLPFVIPVSKRKVFFHGTTRDCADAILKNGFRPFNATRAWNCSDEKYAYMYSLDKMLNAYDDSDVAYREAVLRAFENGAITNAVSWVPNSYVVVLEYQFNEDDIKDIVKDDTSCPNMEYEAVQFRTAKINELLKAGKCNIITHHFKFNVCLTPFYVIGAYHNEFFRGSQENKDLFNCSMLYAALDILDETGHASDILYAIEDYLEEETTLNRAYIKYIWTDADTTPGEE